MTSLAVVLAAMTLGEAVSVVLDSPNACSPARYAEARECVYRGAQDGMPVPQFIISITTNDAEIARNLQESSQVRIEEMAKRDGDPLAWYLLSVRDNDLSMLEKAVKAGEVHALNAMGTFLVQSVQTSKSMGEAAKRRSSARAFECFRSAAQQGDANGYVNLGTCHKIGIGCPKNQKLAHECYETAAKAGHREAMVYVAAGYDTGCGVEKDATRALYWQMRAKADHGDQSAAKWLKAVDLRSWAAMW